MKDLLLFTWTNTGKWKKRIVCERPNIGEIIRDENQNWLVEHITVYSDATLIEVDVGRRDLTDYRMSEELGWELLQETTSAASQS